MTRQLVFITSPLEEVHVARIRSVAPGDVEVIHEPDLHPPTRYVADHKGIAGFQRTAEQESRWRAHLGRATILWDFPAGRIEDGGGLSLAPNVVWVQTTSSGVGQLVKDFGLVDSDVVVTTARGIHAGPLAEFTMMALLNHTKRLNYLMEEQCAHRWERYCGEGLSGKTMLVVGSGKVGSEVGRLAGAFGMRVEAIVRQPSPVRLAELNAQAVFGLDGLEEAVGRADAIVLAAPHTPATDGIFNRPVMARLKPGVVLVNISRGQLVDEEALIEALQDGRIGFAALDVARVEPLPTASALWDMPNVLISPHSASTVASENEAITDIFCHNMRHFLSGRRSEMLNVLNKAEMY
jgi:phosphoglycerate dehydrogenase-like enzyme